MQLNIIVAGALQGKSGWCLRVVCELGLSAGASFLPERGPGASQPRLLSLGWGLPGPECCPLWQHWMGIGGSPGKCELQINGKQCFHISIVHVTAVREAARTYTKKLFLVYLNSTFNWTSCFYLFVCLLWLYLATPRSTVLGSASQDHVI